MKGEPGVLILKVKQSDVVIDTCAEHLIVSDDFETIYRAALHSEHGLNEAGHSVEKQYHSIR